MTVEECTRWEAEGGWIGWIIPPGVVALDIDKDGWQERDYLVREICGQQGLKPATHRTDNGVHNFFKTALNISGTSSGFTKCGIKVTYRAGGKNYLILAPTNGRTWEVPLHDNLPELPHELTPYDTQNKKDLVNVLSFELGETYRTGILAGHEDIDEAFMAFLIESGLDETAIHQAFRKLYLNSFDQRRTLQMYQRAKNRMSSSKQVRGVGSFFYALKEKGLKDLMEYAQRISVTHNEDWADPIPFDSFSLLPGFPVESLQGAGRSFVESVAQNNQVNAGLPATLYLSMLGACLSKRARVDLGSHQEPLNIFTCVILDSGHRKTSTQDLITKPLYEYQASEQEKLRDEIRTKGNAHKVRETRLQELQRKAAKEDDTSKRAELMGQAEQVIKAMAENPVPVLPLLVMDDTTAEALAHAMAQNGERMAIFSAEAGLFDIMGGRYTDGKAQNLDIFLKGHAGDACSTHRIGREPVVMLNPALTLGLAVQSDVLSDLAVVKRFRGRGLLARILFVLCPSQVGYRDRQRERIPKELTDAYRKHIFELMDIPLNQGLICLSAAAESAWDSFYGDVERLMRPGERLEHLTDWGSKLPGAVARISGLLHFAEHRERGLILPISESTVLSACVIGAYYLEHALAVFGVMREDPRIKAAKTILDYISQHPEPFKVRVLIEKKRVFKTVEDVMPGIKVLLERGYIRERAGEYQGKGSPESTTYEVNPRISSLDKPSAEYSKSHEKSNSAVFC